MSIVVVPLACVLKAWHGLLSGVLHLSPSASWIGALVLMVVSIRLAIFPLTYRQFRSARALANLRPRLHAMAEEYRDRHDSASRKEEARLRKEIQSSGGYRAIDGCLPALLQIPIVLGLYRIIVDMSRPPEGPFAPHSPIGPISSADIDAFLSTHFLGAPVSAFVAMTPEQLTALGTDRPTVLGVALPLMCLAAFFTTANWAYSQYRNLQTVDHSSVFARGMIKLFWVFGPFMLAFPFIFGLLGPAPIAILMYWVMSNLWTVAQTVIIQWRLSRTMPLTEEFRAHSRASRARVVARRVELRSARRELMRLRKLNDATLAPEDLAAKATRVRELDAIIHGPRRDKAARKRARAAQARAERAASRGTAPQDSPDSPASREDPR